MPPPCSAARLLPPPEPVITADSLRLMICLVIHSGGRGALRGSVVMLMEDVEERLPTLLLKDL